ncbi:bestrophin family protein [Amaricoccus solimangrovi]|uniref:Bestrophin n=1 Tax=Amaricoccus solimangrovi TaxID=2589815 RepID=A0A501WJ67_9RHOB|nr:bestrophin family ion channel [Amaricoccus solimangrovi]TPE45656.1 hypothetical protein FJM51_22585 [Amaricoccus solimangrovi]
MYVRGGLNPRRLSRGSWRLFLVAIVLSLAVYLIHDRLGFQALEVPALPVATIGIVVSVFLGFVSASAYARWWEARTVWGEIINASRSWANSCLTLTDPVAGAEGAPDEVALLARRHLAWVNALCFQLRPMPTPAGTEETGAAVPGSRDRYLSFLSEQEADTLAGKANPAVHILRLQGEALRRMRRAGQLDDYRLVELVRALSGLYDCQGKCERIRNTPFPEQFTYFGRLFTWMLIVLLPFAFVDAFVRLADNYPVMSVVARDYIYALVPFNTLISWVFFLLQRVSESCSDPFDGKPTDVPIAALTRLIEIDLLQMLGEDAPKPCQPVEGALY